MPTSLWRSRLISTRGERLGNGVSGGIDGVNNSGSGVDGTIVAVTESVSGSGGGGTNGTHIGGSRSGTSIDGGGDGSIDEDVVVDRTIDKDVAVDGSIDVGGSSAGGEDDSEAHAMSIAQRESVVAPLSSDLFYDILRRLDGATLARAACACVDFNSISREELLWENVCRSLWPSTNREEVRSLISSVGGFRKFYADCFPLIVNKDVPPVHSNANLPYPEDWIEADYYEDIDESENISPSYFVSIVDVRYKDKSVYSKVIWGIPDSGGYNGWFYNCPFRIDLLSYSDGDDASDGEVFLSVADGLPPIASIERERKDGKLWRELHNGIKLSWIIVNTRLKQAANLASWSPLGGQRHWPTDRDFLLRFGSILPAKNILPCRVAECILIMKFRITDGGNGEGGMMPTLKLTELSMQLEDMGGAHVNGWNSLLVLKEALSCQRSKNYSEVLESCHLYLKAQSELKEEKMRNESWLDRLCIIGGIAAFATLCYWIL